VIVGEGGRAQLTLLTLDACLLFAVPALTSALGLVVLGAIARGRRRP
jgi:hypothetical protein